MRSEAQSDAAAASLPPPYGIALPRYHLDDAYDEMFAADGQVRPEYEELLKAFLDMPAEELQARKLSSDASFMTQGITFTVYGREEGTERIFPYDLLPRLITGKEWEHIEKGLTQRITALNLFLRDVYHEGKILSDGVIPREVVYTCKH